MYARRLSSLLSSLFISSALAAPVGATEIANPVEIADHAASLTPQKSPTVGLEHLEQSERDTILPLSDSISIRFPDSALSGDVQGIATIQGKASLVAEQLAGEGTRFSKVYSAPAEDLAFDFSFDGAERVEDSADGGLTIFDANGEPSFFVLSPWARDAHGRELPTHYEYDDQRSQVRQVVEADDDTVFPVTVDPEIHRWGPVPQIDFNREETGRLRNPSAGLALVAGACAAIGPETLGTGCAISAAEMGYISTVASNAYGDGRCVALRAGLVPVTIDCK